ncbi:MAG: protein kinase domain-containing protein [Planctomycetota bacterium]|jgi:serine/threonine protein kinase
MSGGGENLFGKIAITRGLVTPKELLRQGKNIMLGQIMFERGYLTKEQVIEILETQKKAILICGSCGTKYNVAGFEPGRKVKCRVCRTVLRVPRSVETVRVDKVIDEAPKDPLAGKDVGVYKLEYKLGAGGMSSVYMGVHTGLEKKMAIKLLPKDRASEEQADRFMREARVVAKLEHKHIVGVYDVGENDEFFYLAMEYLEGRTLDDLLSNKEKLDPYDASTIVRDVAGALDAAHQQGIIHRDIKPDNIMIEPDGTVKVTDFGLAKMKGGRADITRAGVILGTPFFMSPEQCERKTLDIRSDLYSLGVTYYNAVTGKKPFEGGKPAEIMFSHINEDPIPPNLLEPTLPYEVTAVILKLMKKDRSERYQTPKELIDAINDILPGLK